MPQLKRFSWLLSVLITLSSVNAWAAPGDLDPTFGSGGKVITSFGVDDYSSAAAVLIQPDGKIVAAGVTFEAAPYDFAIMRYLPDGTPDPDFGAAGQVTTDLGGYDAVAAIVRQADGKLVVAGYTYDGISDYDFALARYNDDGSLDGSFGTSGIVTTELGGVELGSALVVQPDQKLVVAGRLGAGDFALVRYNNDGTLDATFGVGGIVVTDLIPDGLNGNTTLALQTDGRLVVAGSIGTAVAEDAEDIAVARYDSDGSLDATFGTGGLASLDVGGMQNLAVDVVIQPDGKLLLACWPGFACGVVRLNADGTADTTFGSGGNAPVSSTDNFYHLSLEADGRILAVGASNDFSSISDFSVTRYTADGSLDLVYGSDGRTTTDFELEGETASGSALQADGKLVVAGGAFVGAGRRFALARYEGGIDPTTCTVAPMPGCQGALPGAKLQLRDDDTDSKDKVAWKWKAASVLQEMDFASPTTTTDYAFCVYDATGRRLAVSAPAGNTCAGKPCWKDTSNGFKYGDKALSPDGFSKLILVAGEPGKGKLGVKARGEPLVMPTLGLTLPVVAQLQASPGTTCWEGTYTTMIHNDSERFQAASD